MQALRRELAYKPLDQRFPRIDMKFMDHRQWIDKRLMYSCGLPRFAAFSVNCPTCILTFDHAITDNQGLSNLFAVSAKELKSFKHSFCKPTIAAKFQGGLPLEVRQEVDRQRQLFDDVIVVTPAPYWSVEAEPKPQSIPEPCDAMLIGRRDDDYWLIRSFRTVASACSR